MDVLRVGQLVCVDIGGGLVVVVPADELVGAVLLVEAVVHLAEAGRRTEGLAAGAQVVSILTRFVSRSRMRVALPLDARDEPHRHKHSYFTEVTSSTTRSPGRRYRCW